MRLSEFAISCLGSGENTVEVSPRNFLGQTDDGCRRKDADARIVRSLAAVAQEADLQKMKQLAKSLTLYAREAIALLFALAVVLLVALLSYRGWTAFERYADQLVIAQALSAGTTEFLIEITNAETGQRGYLLTGNDSYLEPYYQAVAKIPDLFRSLERATKKRPDQARRLESLKPIIDEQLQELARTIELRRTKGLSAALAVVRTNRGRLLMAQVRKICSEIRAVANARLRLAFAEALKNGDRGGLTSILGSSSLLFLLVVANITIHRGVARRQALIDELQQSERRLEETASDAQAANRAKSTFLSTMSHEIRTPLHAILGYAQLMLRDPNLGTGSKANLKIIGRSGEHLLTLINTVLDMSRIEAGRTELRPVTFNLSHMLDDLAAMFQQRAQAKMLQFEMVLDGEVLPYLIADEGKIRQVLINLLGNAIKFTKRGKVKLHVNLSRKNIHSLWLSAAVEDTGAGIMPEELGRLFEPFSQTEGKLNAQEGTGLGLAISRAFAKLMGGDVTLTSTPGKGSTFQLEIPVERGNSGIALREANSSRVKCLRAGTVVPKILVADDQRENRDWLMKLLSAIGYAVQVAEDGEGAIQKWEEWRPNMILMDIHMPVMDGLEAIRRIKADPRGNETTILVLTASALEEHRPTVSDIQADGFVTKPCREGDLLEKMRALLHIEYEYEEEALLGEPLALDATTTLTQLPGGLAEQLRNATSAGNKKLLDKLILQVRESEAGGAADVMQEVADRYDYDALMLLLEKT